MAYDFPELMRQMKELQDQIRSLQDQQAINARKDRYTAQTEYMHERWQAERADNVGAGAFPLVLRLYIPPTTKRIHQVLLRFTIEDFRTYETGAAAGGATVVSPTTSTEPSSTPTTSTEPSSTPTTSTEPSSSPTSSNGGSYSNTPSSSNSNAGTSISSSGYVGYSGPSVDDTYGGGGHDHGGAVAAEPDHAHSLYPHGHTITDPGHYHTVSISIPNHQHTVTIPAHQHSVTIGGHQHTVTIPAHSHTVTVTLSDHTHPLVYGIFTSTAASTVTVTINGVNRTAALGGGAGFAVDQDSLDITQWVVTGWNTVSLGSATLGRLHASLFTDLYIP